MNRFDLLAEVRRIEAASPHKFQKFPSLMETAVGDVWYSDCIRCGRSVMLLPGAEHTVGTATDADWCMADDPVPAPPTEEE